MSDKSVSDLVETMKVLQALQPQAPAPSPARDDKDITKTVVGGVVALIGAIILALVFWVGSSVNSLSSVVTRMSANMDTLQKTVNDIQAAQNTTGQQLADGKAVNAKQDARQDAVEADINRIKERVRMLEGQKPVRVGPSE